MDVLKLNGDDLNAGTVLVEDLLQKHSSVILDFQLAVRDGGVNEVVADDFTHGGFGCAVHEIRGISHIEQVKHGVLDFVLNGEAVGPKILEWKQEKSDMAASEEDKGSIMSILATDLPVTSRQLKRILKRTGVGIARTGGYTGHGSGEVMIGFTTANRIPSGYEEELVQISAIPENIIDRAFLAAAEAEQEAILNSMTAAEQIRGIAGELYYSLAEYLEDRES